MTGVRWREDGFEGQCDYCREWWPLDLEFWRVSKRSMRMCRACLREYARLKQAERRQDPAKRAVDRADVYSMRQALSDAGLLGEYRRRWYLNNRERILAAKRVTYAAKRAAAGKDYAPRVERPDPHVLSILRQGRAA